MQVRDGMSEVVLTVGPTHTLREAAQMMAEKGPGRRWSSTTSRRPRIVTERDILSRSATARTPTPSGSPTT